MDHFGTEGYYKKMLELQEKLRRSEEERLKLEEKFNEMMRLTRDAEHERLRVLRHKYHKFLEDDKIRQERNENILRTLDRIESRAKSLAAKTDRFKALRKQYENYIKRVYLTNNKQQPEQQTSPQPDSNYSHSNVRKKLFADLPTADSAESKLAMLEEYLRDNFQNFPRDLNPKTRENVLKENQLFNNRQNGFNVNPVPEEPSHLRQNDNRYFDMRNNYGQPEIIDSDSKESQDYSDIVPNGKDYQPNQINGHARQQEYSPKYSVDNSFRFTKTINETPPKKSEILGTAIEKELDRFRDKENAKDTTEQKSNLLDTKQVLPDPYVQDYKDLVSKSEEKYGLRSSPSSPKKESPILKTPTPPKENIPQTTNIFDNVNKTININELQNISETKLQPTEEIVSMFDPISEPQESQESENENPIIRKYKQVAKSLSKEEFYDDNSDKQIKKQTSSDNIVVNKKELEKEEDNLELNLQDEEQSDRTEPPADISLNLSSPTQQHERQIPEESIKEDSSKSQEFSSEYAMENLPENQALKSPSVLNEKNMKLPNEETIQNQPEYEQDISQQSNSDTTMKEHSDYNNAQQSNDYQDGSYEQQNIVPSMQEVENVQDYNSQQESTKQFTNADENNPVLGEHLEEQPNYQYDKNYPESDIPAEAVYQEGYPNEPNTALELQYPANYDEQQYVGQDTTAPVYEEGYDNQSYPPQEGIVGQYSNPEQYNEGHEVYQGKYQQPEGYESQNYPTQEPYVEGQSEIYDSEQFSKDQQQYPVDQQQYPTDQQQYPPDQQQFSSDQQQYSPDQQQYPPDSQQYPPDQQQFPPDQQQYPPDQQQFPPDQQQFPPDQQQYPPEQYEGYTDPNYPAQEYVEGQPVEYDPQQYPQGYPADGSNQYDQQHYPEGYNQNIYSSGQEYLEGEQNIDMQYQTEQGDYPNQEYQPEQYPEGYSEQDYQQNQQYPADQPVEQQQQLATEVQSQEVRQESSLNVSGSIEITPSQNVPVVDKPLVEKTLPNLADMLDTDTESTKQDTKVSNDSDFDFSTNA